jgi:demethylmenaquinone methyltransferase/2-methoxy-6-polyprenyl-1,4-benzoquinol methylase
VTDVAPCPLSDAESVRAVAEYYAARAQEYDLTAGYEDPAAEPLRAQAKARCQELFRGADVLEIACGTGYWTKVVAQAARSVLATDACEEMLATARKRLAACENVRFQVADAYSLAGVPSGFNAACAVWWWSHVPKRLIPRFLTTLHSKLRPGARVLFVDQLPSAYVARGRRVEAGGDTTEVRQLSGGRDFRVVKNFPGRGDVMEALASLATDVEHREFPQECSWSVTYRVKG